MLYLITGGAGFIGSSLAGADPDGDIGECHDPETHLIPLVLDVALGKRKYVRIFGTDYITPDGTCIRNYVHVTDLAEAQHKALIYLVNGGCSDAFNLGKGNGFSVRAVIETARAVTGRIITATDWARRDGDAPVLIGSSDKAKKELKWKPRYDDLAVIIKTAWNWHMKPKQH